MVTDEVDHNAADHERESKSDDPKPIGGPIVSLERPIAPNPYDLLPQLPSFTLESDDVTDGQPLGDGQIQAGGDTSPHLRWSGAPGDTGSYVVSCFDPDAPTPSGFWHWMLVDLPATTTELAAGETPPAGTIAIRNDAGITDYYGAAPPEGDHPHRYFFVVHSVAADTLGVPADASPAVVSFNLAFKATARAIIVGT